MNPKLRAQLDQIQQWLLDPDGSEALWDVLTALRGPDTGNLKGKLATTAVIRLVAFPGLANCETIPFTVFCEDAEDSRGYRVSEMISRDHFSKHAKRAFDALDLVWGRVNQERR